MKKRLLLPLCLVSLATHAESGGQHYRCSDGAELAVAYSTADDGRQRATARLDTRSVTLPRAPSASGTLYRRGDVLLAIDGDKAVFNDGSGKLRRCQSTAAMQLSRAPAPARAPAIRSSFLDVAGSIGYGTALALPPDAVLTLSVVDGSRGGRQDRTLAEQRIVLRERHLHIPFRTTIDRDLIGRKARLLVSARIEQGGRLRYRGERGYTVANTADSVPVHLWLEPVAQP